MNKEKPGVVEKTKRFGKEMGFSLAEAYFGLLLATGFPALVPTLAGVIFISRGVDRFKTATGM